jgi:hypothetical protein
VACPARTAFKARGREQVVLGGVGEDRLSLTWARHASGLGSHWQAGPTDLPNIQMSSSARTFKFKIVPFSASKIHEKTWGDRGDKRKQLSFWLKLQN